MGKLKKGDLFAPSKCIVDLVFNDLGSLWWESEVFNPENGLLKQGLLLVFREGIRMANQPTPPQCTPPGNMAL